MEDHTPIPRNDRRVIEWLQNWIHAFRARVVQTERKYLPYLQEFVDFSKPTQAFHIGVKSPEIEDSHFILVTHSSRLQDLHLESWGPVGLKRVLDVLDEFDKIPVLDDEARERRRGGLWETRNPDTPRKLRFKVDPHLNAFHGNLRSYVFIPHRADTNLFPGTAGTKAAVWTHHGDLLRLEPARQLDEFFAMAADNYHRVREHRKKTRGQPKVAASPPPRERWTGYYAYLYPRVLVGQKPELPIRDRLFGEWIHGPGRVVLRPEKDGLRFFVTRNGAIGIELPNKGEALRVLNLVVRELNLMKKDSRFLREKDLAGFENRTDERTGTPQFGSYGFPEGFIPGRERESHDWFLTSNGWLSDAQVRTAITRAVSGLKDVHANKRILLLEAESHLRESAARQAFFLAWLLLETHLTETWEAVLRGLSKAEAVQMNDDTATWRVLPISRALTMAGKISPQIDAKIRTFNKRRNKIVHEAEEPRDAEVRSLLDLVAELLSTTVPLNRWGRRRNVRSR